MTEITKTMYLYKSHWGQIPTFKMLPLTRECPYVECLFDPMGKILAILSKDKQESLKMIAKLDLNGDPEKTKNGKRPNGKDYKEERRTIATHMEFYIEDKTDVLQFIAMHAVNLKEFPLDDYFRTILSPEVVTAPKLEIVSK